jgi:hypothetical protein
VTQRRRRLDTAKVIADYLGLSVRAVRRLASMRRPAELRLPLFRMTDAIGANARVYALVDELDAWEARMAAAPSQAHTATQ